MQVFSLVIIIVRNPHSLPCKQHISVSCLYTHTIQVIVNEATIICISIQLFHVHILVKDHHINVDIHDVQNLVISASLEQVHGTIENILAKGATNGKAFTNTITRNRCNI
jgi:hypothetical protein